MLITVAILISALVLDYMLGEAKKYHPLIFFGNLAIKFEKQFNRKHAGKVYSKIFGVFCWVCLVLPLPLVYYLVHKNVAAYFVLDAFILYFAIGLNSLKQHAMNVYSPLKANDLPQARKAVSMLVSRQTSELTESQISRATVESVLENGHDAIIASLFWFVIGGAPAVILHRLSNTLDECGVTKPIDFYILVGFLQR
jgi:adenosylcobinamide-phosphate synthase